MRMQPTRNLRNLPRFAVAVPWGYCRPPSDRTTVTAKPAPSPWQPLGASVLRKTHAQALENVVSKAPPTLGLQFRRGIVGAQFPHFRTFLIAPVRLGYSTRRVCTYQFTLLEKRNDGGLLKNPLQSAPKVRVYLVRTGEAGRVVPCKSACNDDNNKRELG